jgi:hypothetical protein
MKKIVITFITCIIYLFVTAQNDTISVIGIINDIKPIYQKDTSQSFEIKAKTLGIISGEIDSTIVFYIHSPEKQLLLTDYQNADTYKEKIYYFILKTDNNKIIFIDALSPNILVGKCPKCNKQLQGFRFLGDSFAHYIYYCPTHGKINEEWEHYD